MSYDLENMEELYMFSSDCEEACCECPQYSSWNPIDFDMGRNEVSPFDVFMFWRENKELFEYGYYEYLSPEAKQTFVRYVIKHNMSEEGEPLEDDVIDTETGLLLSKQPRPVLVFNKD